MHFFKHLINIFKILFRSVSKDRNCKDTIPFHEGHHDQPSSSSHSNWHSKSNDKPESLNSNGGSWRKEKSKSNRNHSNERSSRNRSSGSRNRRNRLVVYFVDFKLTNT